MQPSLKKSEHITSLATSSVLVHVDISVWGATKSDKSISDEVTTAKKADKDAGRFIKNLLANDPDHKRVLNYRQTIYNWLQHRAYPWSKAQFALAHILLPKFMEEWRMHEKTFGELVDTFCAKYPTIQTTMAMKQGDMFNRDDYPSVDQVRNKFSIHLYVNEIPQSDYRCQISQDLANELYDNYNGQLNRIIGDIMTKQTQKLVNVMSSISHCCDPINTVNTGGETKTKKRRIYDTTITKALELCDEYRGFNPANDQALEEARAGLERALSGVSLDTLRESDEVRAQVKNDVDDILAKFKPRAVQ